MSDATSTNKKENEEEASAASPLATISEVFSFIPNDKTKLHIACGFFFAVLAGLALPASLFLFADVMGDVSAVAEEGIGPVVEVAYTMMVLGVISLVTETLVVGFMETAANEMTQELKSKWFQAVVRQDMAYFDLEDVSGTATIISTNGAKFHKGVGVKLGHGVQYGVTVVAGFALAFWASWKVTLTTLAVVPVMAGATGWVLKINQSKTKRDNEAYAKAGSVVYQTASSIRTILALNAAEEVIERFENATQQAYDGAVSQLVWLGMANGSLMGSFMLAYIVIVGYGGYILYDAVAENGCDASGAITTNQSCDPSGADIFLALMGVIFGGAMIPQISTSLEALQGARTACFPALLAMSRTSKTGDKQRDSHNEQYAKELVARTTKESLPDYAIDVTSDVGKRPASVKGNIEFKNVSFHYPTRKETQVFDGFNLTIQAGQTVALVGPR